MEIFSTDSRNITDLLVQYHNKEIDKQNFNIKIFLAIAFNYFYFTKESKKETKLNDMQNKIYQSFYKKEAAHLAAEKILKSKVKQKKETQENAEKIISEQKRELMDNLFKNKDISTYAEHSYNSYIPPKNYSLSFNFHLSDFKENKKYLSASNAEITYKNPSFLNKKKDKIITSYSEQPYIIDEDNDVFLMSKNETNNSDNENIIEITKKENQNEIKKIINDEDDDLMFYSEKLETAEDIKKSSNWLNEFNQDEINNNFSDLMKIRKNNKNFNNSNYFLFDSNILLSEFDPTSIFDDIPLMGDRFKKFSEYLNDKSYKNFMKKMNYNYLDLMLLKYFDLHLEFKKYDFLQREDIAKNFIKKLLLNAGICITKIYDQIIKAIMSKKGNFNFENFLDCFTPILESPDKYQTLKYRFLLFLSKTPNSNIYTMENYKVFCNLIKGKSVYEDDKCKQLSKNMIENFKQKYPKELTDNFKYFQIATIVEFLVDKENVE